MAPINDHALCSTCGNTWQWHQDHKPRHDFVNAGEEAKLQQPTPPLPAPKSGDPILRLALIKTGVILEKDLDEAQLWLNEAIQQGKAVVVENNAYQLVDFAEQIQRIMAARQ
jgi:hypothetical protein